MFRTLKCGIAMVVLGLVLLPAASLAQSLTVNDCTVTGPIVQGRDCHINVSCNVLGAIGTLHVIADLSQIGGSSSQELDSRADGHEWRWSGFVHPTTDGPRTVSFATDDTPPTATASVTVNVLASLPKITPTSYTYNVEPKYCENTKDGSRVKLTDGAYVSSDEWFFLNAPAVGWLNPGPLEITFDLGQVEAIKGVSFSTAADYFWIDWPYAIDVLVSDDGTNYHHACELISLSSEHGLPFASIPYVHPGVDHRWTYWTDQLSTHGQYVKLVVAGGQYIFVDEVEVYHDVTGSTTSDLGATVTVDASLQRSEVLAGIVRRIVLDAQDVLSQVTSADPFVGQGGLESDLASIISSAKDLPAPPNPSAFTTELPLDARIDIEHPKLHPKVFHDLAALWQAMGKADLIVWQTPLWDPMSVTQTPSSGSPDITLKMMQNEYRAGAFNLSNPTDTDMTVNVSISLGSLGTNPSFVTVHQVAWTDTSSGVPVAAALPVLDLNLDGTYHVNVPSGMTRQVWLTFHPTEVDPDTYTGDILVNNESSGTISLTVSSVAFPAQPTLSLSGWDYTNGCDAADYYCVTSANRDALIQHLREHFVDTTWGKKIWYANLDLMPTDSPSFTQFDAWAQRWAATPSLPAARNYRIALNVPRPPFDGFAGYDRGTPEFNQAVGAWISAYAAHWQAAGLDLKQIALLIEDEPGTPEVAASIVAWATAIHAAQPDLLVWEDPQYISFPFDGSTEFFDACDVLCPALPTFVDEDEDFREVYRSMPGAGKTLNFYSAWGPARLMDPYSYYRLQAWDCWREGATGMSYWAFGGSEQGSSWNEYLAGWDYTPFYLDSTTVTPGKHMEAIREGIEDYEYLVMLKDRIHELRASPNPPPQIDYYAGQLDDAPATVLDPRDENTWSDSYCVWSSMNLVTRDQADAQRLLLLTALENLDGGPVSAPPAVTVGPVTEVFEGQMVDLYATASGLDNGTLEYAWTKTRGPTVTLTGADTDHLSYTAPTLINYDADEQYYAATQAFRVTVTDGYGGSASATANVRVYLGGDCNHDDAVDVVDLETLVEAFGSDINDTSTPYNPQCDFNYDGSVDVVDLETLTENFGRALGQE